ncbi:MAG: RpiB/LacA/LacB family sugar-phosphate isomerase [Bacilli bacterium]|nr:RpiB/LacA/LacB family sugar-phosphate isomerase [Bacilli bacterium]
MKIGLVSDHHGIEKREKIKKYLENKGYTVVDYGPNEKKSVDYPEFAYKLSKGVINKDIDVGILMCGTGIGMSIAANKVKGIRCARVVSKEDAMYASLHNHANEIAFSANLPFMKIKKIIDTYLNTTPSEEERHVRRVNMIDNYND